MIRTMKRDIGVMHQVSLSDGCWEWLGAKDQKGYGLVRYLGEKLRAHRLVYRMMGLTIPSGYYLDHSCRNHSCVNPEHLGPVTPKQNSIENSIGPTAINAQKTHCKRGHPLTDENTYRNTRKIGWRACIQCQRKHSAYSKQRRKPSKQT